MSKKLKHKRTKFVSHSIPLTPTAPETAVNPEPVFVPSTLESEMAPIVEPAEDEGNLEEHELYPPMTEEEELLLSEHDEHFDFQPKAKPVRPSGHRTSGLKRLLVVFGGLVVVALVGGVVYGAMKQNDDATTKKKSYQQAVLTEWQALVVDSRDIRQIVTSLAGLSDFGALDTSLTKEQASLKTDIANLSTVAVPSQYQKFQAALVSFLVDYSDYLDNMGPVLQADTSDAVKNVTDKQLSDLVAQGKTLSQNEGLLRTSSDFLRIDLDSSVFEVMPFNVQRIVLAELTRQQQTAQQLQQQQQQADALKQQQDKDKQDAQITTETFLQDYIDGKKTAAKALLGLDVVDKYNLVQDPTSKVTAYEVLTNNANQGGFYSLIVKLNWQKTSSPSITSPLGQPFATTSNQEIRAEKLNNTWQIIYVDFLE